MNKYDDEEDDSPTRDLSTTDDEENNETEDPFDSGKPSPIVAAQIEIAVKSPIAAVPILVTNTPVFPSAKVPTSLS